MRNKIVYSKWTFNDDAIKLGSISIHTAVNPLSNLLEADTFTAVVKTTDKSITNFTKNTPLRYYHRDVQRFLAYIQAVDREGPNEYRLTGTSAVGLLMDRLHKGGIYTGQTAQTVLQEICGSVAFSLKSTFRNVKLYGWLPYARPPERSARDNLCQVLFALGCTAKADVNGTLQIAPLSSTVAGTITQAKIYSGSSVKYGAPVSAVTVTEHQYMVGGEETKLYEGSTNEGDIIIFSEPIYGLKAEGFTIRESNANYAKVSIGNGTLIGRKYIHTTRQITKAVTSGAAENVKTISDATLISVVNSNSAAERMAAYYKCLETIQCGIVMDTQAAGELRNIYHSYNKNTVKSCVESIDVSASGILRGDVKALVGYEPPKYTQNLDRHLVITSSGTITLPDGVTRVRAVLIGGGTGGTGGGKGESGTAGSNATASSSSGLVTNKGAPGKGGKGGKGSEGGSGGKIAIFEISGTSIKNLSVSIGSKGTGGAVNEGAPGAGGNTTLTVNGTTYSSASGDHISTGFQDVVSGTIYGLSGKKGKDGADGGAGGAPTTTEGVVGEDGSPIKSAAGGAGGVGGHTGSGSRYGTGTGGGGGGGAAYAVPGGNGSAATGTRAGAGGKGGNGTEHVTFSPIPGTGGGGGDGGGGGGGGGGTLAAAMSGGSITVYGGAAGIGGDGGPGEDGAPGCVILFYGYPQIIE